MIEKARHFTVDLAVIGTGIAGFAAAIFALNRNLETAQIGSTGALSYTTGYLDLLGALEGSPGPVDRPWENLSLLKAVCPGHPLASVPAGEIREGFSQFTAFLSNCGIGYTSPGESNITALTPAGTLKKTLCVPKTMENGPRAYARQAPCAIIDFKGLKGFSAPQVVANLREKWPTLSSRRLIFPDMNTGEIYPEMMARALEVPATREKLATLLKDIGREVKVIGLPAILGMHRPDHVHSELERLTGLTIFEIPTMPPSVPGTRLREMFEQVLPQKGQTLIARQKVEALTFTSAGAELCLADTYGPVTISAQTVILATGRFLSGGLNAHLTGISEPLLDLPVIQPGCRADWYRKKYTDSRGHAINKAGIEVDATFRPLGVDGMPYDERLFAAGIILAHQDWIRGRSGAGVAIASAYAAVQAADRFLHSTDDRETKQI